MCFAAHLLLWAGSVSVDIYLEVSLQNAIYVLVEMF